MLSFDNQRNQILSEIWQKLRENGLNGITFDGEVILDDNLTLNGFRSDGTYINTSTNDECDIADLDYPDLRALQDEVEFQIYNNNKAMSKAKGLWY